MHAMNELVNAPMMTAHMLRLGMPDVYDGHNEP